ncbi:hypothetical protein EVAR_38009_1 [Eumeta japonica]|uniref:Uncharacterized protein n=1 Tax=Eumeta variegata TaxID=151549 RepID=A0A4C1WYE2_EUMVA|nr:hypothetical protein EVAR_38009_1 [Eumeta japonica]
MHALSALGSLGKEKGEKTAFVLTKTIEGSLSRVRGEGSRFWDTRKASRFLNHERRGRASPRKPRSSLTSARTRLNQDERAAELRSFWSSAKTSRTVTDRNETLYAGLAVHFPE